MEAPRPPHNPTDPGDFSHAKSGLLLPPAGLSLPPGIDAGGLDPQSPFVDLVREEQMQALNRALDIRARSRIDPENPKKVALNLETAFPKTNDSKLSTVVADVVKLRSDIFDEGNGDIADIANEHEDDRVAKLPTPPVPGHTAPASPEFRPVGLDVFDGLALGGIRRGFERRKQQKPEKKVLKPRYDAAFQKQLGHTAFSEAGLDELAADFELSADEATTLEQGKPRRKHRRAARAITGHRKKPGLAAELKQVTEELDMVRAGTRMAEDRAAKEELEGRILRGETDGLEDFVPSHHHHKNKAEKKLVRKQKELITTVTLDTKTSASAMHVTKKAERKEKKLTKAPAKTQKRIAKLRRKVERKDKYKRGGKKIIKGVVKAPGKAVSKVKNVLNSPPSAPMSAFFDKMDAFTDRADKLMMRYNPVELMGQLIVGAAVTTEKVYDHAKSRKKINK